MAVRGRIERVFRGNVASAVYCTTPHNGSAVSRYQPASSSSTEQLTRDCSWPDTALIEIKSFVDPSTFEFPAIRRKDERETPAEEFVDPLIIKGYIVGFVRPL